jgi:hypothetical protein
MAISWKYVFLGTDHLTWRGRGYGFLFHSEFFLRTTHELEYFFICRVLKCILYFYNIKCIKGIKCQYLKKKTLYQIKAFNLFFIMEFTSWKYLIPFKSYNTYKLLIHIFSRNCHLITKSSEYNYILKRCEPDLLWFLYKMLSFF